MPRSIEQSNFFIIYLALGNCQASKTFPPYRVPTLEQTMRRLVAAAATVMIFAAITPGMAQQPAGRSQLLTTMPAGKTVNNYYKQSVYDPQKNKIGSVEDVLIGDDGRVMALIIGVGGFLGAGEKDVAVPFSAIHAEMKDGSWYLTLDTTKDALKSAPGYTFDKTKTTWVPAS
jgi:sporulation protein YlmC with PRC-barrel domain